MKYFVKATLAVLLVVLSACGKDHDSNPRDTSPPSIAIDTPTTAATYITASTPITLGGTASDNVSVASVEWSNAATGNMGTASGTMSWTASLDLAVGPNSITVTAFDAAGNMGTDTLTVMLCPGILQAWGRNQSGQLGDGTMLDSLFPVDVVSIPGVTDLSAGNSFSLALLCDGTVWSWGSNASGQLGDGTTQDRATPVQVLDPTSPSGFLEDVAAIAAGTSHSLTLLADGTVLAWGDNQSGQLGDGTTIDSALPTSVVDPLDPSGLLQGVTAIAGGELHSVVLLSDNTVWTWGGNVSGQLGDGTMMDSLIPVQVSDPGDPTGFLENVTAVSAGGRHTVAIIVNATVRAWGTNGSGELGDNRASGINSPIPVVVFDPTDPSGWLTNVDAIASSPGAAHTIALIGGGTVMAWGLNAEGQLGDGTTATRLTAVPVVDTGDPTGFLTGVSSLTAGAQHNASLKGDGTFWTWGWNSFGQLGDGTTTNKTTPNRVEDPSDPTGFLQGVMRFAAGAYHSLVLK